MRTFACECTFSVLSVALFVCCNSFSLIRDSSAEDFARHSDVSSSTHTHTQGSANDCYDTNEYNFLN